jgi:DNA-binding XRE family transcriptional regulator
MKLDDYRIECRWSKAEMARQARIDTNTLNRAINGIPVSSDTARKLASAISEGLGRSISVEQIEGLNIIK